MARGRIWTNEEDIILQDLYRKGYSDFYISNELNRTEKSISIRRSILFLVKNEKIHWSEEEKKDLIELRKTGKSIIEISKILRIDIERIRNKLKNIKIN